MSTWVVRLAAPDDLDGWRNAARALIAGGTAPEDVVWQVGDGATDLFAREDASSPIPLLPPRLPSPDFAVPRAFIDRVREAILHRDSERFALLYRVLVRLRFEPKLMDDAADPLVRRIERLATEVHRDIHKMRAFLRFREVDDGAGPRFVAWFEPDHHIVRANAGFFLDRFASMRWSILTPALSLHWDGARLSEGPGAARGDAPPGDPIEDVWKTYYASIFNPARMKVGAMLKEMPRKYWKNMPETALVPGLIASAQARESGMIAKARAHDGGDIEAAWNALHGEAAGCTRCHLYRQATRTVFGEGPVDAALMFVGEQPGDQEDLVGTPFVGPAGQLFDRAIAAAGIDRSGVYVTNAVKHFKFERHGKRRIHQKPDAGEITACRWWIEQELLLVKPKVTVALGATAARTLFGKVMTIGKERGWPHILPGGGEAWITVHPSFLLRLPDRDAAELEFGRFVEDLKTVRERL